jgi:hypothetical protein
MAKRLFEPEFDRARLPFPHLHYQMMRRIAFGIDEEFVIPCPQIIE